MKKVYLVFDENHGMVGVYATKEAASRVVEHLSIVEYGCRREDEIWDSPRGNDMVHYCEEEVKY
jgi:hypothetical protein